MTILAETATIKDVMELVDVRTANCIRPWSDMLVSEFRDYDDRTILAIPAMGRRSLRRLREVIGYSPERTCEQENERLRTKIATLEEQLKTARFELEAWHDVYGELA